MNTLTLNSHCMWLTEREVARIVGISVSTLQKQRFRGCGISYSKIGRAVRYSAQDVKDYMNAHKVQLRAAP